MKLYFARHGESAGNVDGQYSLSTSGLPTALGMRQAEELALRLLELSIDAVVVSPLDRAVLTVLPFLRAAGLAAEAWPELFEMGGRAEVMPQHGREGRSGLPIELIAESEGVVSLRNDPEGRLRPPTDESYVEGCARAAMAAARIRRQYAGRDVSVLMVGHACNGSRVLESLLDIPQTGRFQHGNCGLSLLQQKANGEFVVCYVNRI